MSLNRAIVVLDTEMHWILAARLGLVNKGVAEVKEGSN